MSALSWIENIEKLNNEITQSELVNIKVLITNLYKTLKPIFDSGRVKPQSEINTDFNFDKFFVEDKLVNPDRYFNYSFGLVKIELVRRPNNRYSVRSFNWQFSSDTVSFLSSKGWYSDIKKCLVPKIESSFSSGWYYIGDFSRSEFRVVCEFFDYVVSCFRSDMMSSDRKIDNFICSVGVSNFNRLRFHKNYVR